VSPSLRCINLNFCLAVVRSSEHRPNNFLFNTLHSSTSVGTNVRESKATSSGKIISIAIPIYRRIFPIHLSLQLCKRLLNLLRTMKGFPSDGAEFQASSTASMKLGALGQKASNSLFWDDRLIDLLDPQT
jgi:hypothetical protein